MYAEIIINSNARALNRIFDYIIPNSLENVIKVGSRIFVPFGNGKKLEDGFHYYNHYDGEDHCDDNLY